jgi:hypothetical protein
VKVATPVAPTEGKKLNVPLGLKDSEPSGAGDSGITTVVVTVPGVGGTSPVEDWSLRMTLNPNSGTLGAVEYSSGLA